MATDQAALDTAIKALGDIITAEDVSIQAVVDSVNALISKIQTNPSGDFTNEITALQSMVSDVTTKTASLKTSIDAAKGITG